MRWLEDRDAVFEEPDASTTDAGDETADIAIPNVASCTELDDGPMLEDVPALVTGLLEVPDDVQCRIR